MTRIVSGTAKGRKLKVPKAGTRPTSERAREGIFSRLEHYGYIKGCCILDLYSGSGALGLEALSRGAARVICVEAAPAAVQIIKENCRSCDLPVEVVAQKVQSYLQQEDLPKFDLIMLDPPYALEESKLTADLELCAMHLAEDGMILVERSKKSPEPGWPAGIFLDDCRKWGDTRVWSAVRGENPSMLNT